MRIVKIDIMVIQTIMNGIKDKAIIALFPAGLFVLTDLHKEIIAIILWLLIIDTILGVTVALKRKRFCSYRLTKALYKFLTYMIALATAYLVSVLELPFLEYFYLYVGAFITVTEAVSNFEKLALLGFELPKQLLARLNLDFKNENIEKILNKK